ncbi:hypothetical protein A3Q56_04833 [Intoshia linei]|uniref:K Homology domain-containing protein n=1 Tax=Intoshia linei TaxID=1819745 RepID=A0A177AYX2_9BILA|nr:hypothetical protein A3Q56_04833 [Intoshia linei]
MTSYEEAIKKARQIAAKIQGEGGTNGNGMSASELAAAKVKNLNYKLGSKSSTVGPGVVIDDEYILNPRTHEKLIDNNGSELNRITTATGCKIQFTGLAADQMSRIAKLIGTSESITTTKSILDSITNSIGAGKPADGYIIPLSNGTGMVELTIPGNKCGLIIGKSGETIKMLQERTGVKMLLVQADNSYTDSSKPLRISGELGKLQSAKDFVVDYLTKIGALRADSGLAGDMTEISIPEDKVGLIIGKGGETIKQINAESGAHAQLDQNSTSMLPYKILRITGSVQSVEAAIISICARTQIQPVAFGNKVSQGAGYGYGFDQPQMMPIGSQPWQAQAFNQFMYQPQQQEHQQWAQASADPYYGRKPQVQPYAASINQPGQFIDPNAQMQPQVPMQPQVAGLPQQPAVTTPVQPYSQFTPQQTYNPTTGQMDYSQAWVAYYRAQGMHDKAEEVLSQSRALQAQNAGNNQANEEKQ